MNIIGPDLLVFGVDDVDACRQFASDYGLTASGDHRFVALDGTGDDSAGNGESPWKAGTS